mmetsp:Transcript_78470/g.188147  ORF Transcript_78470/g.188147 Transcript_78470/m.188147 type:complete len:311 (-) Transcript_78470:755-1687(-)
MAATDVLFLAPLQQSPVLCLRIDDCLLERLLLGALWKVAGAAADAVLYRHGGAEFWRPAASLYDIPIILLAHGFSFSHQAMRQVDSAQQIPIARIADGLVILDHRLPGYLDGIRDADLLSDSVLPSPPPIGDHYLDVLGALLGISAKMQRSLHERLGLLQVHGCELTADLLLRLEEPDLAELFASVCQNADHHVLHLRRARLRQILGPVQLHHAADAVMDILQLLVRQERLQRAERTSLGAHVINAHGIEVPQRLVLDDAELNAANHLAILGDLIWPWLVGSQVQSIDLAGADGGARDDAGELHLDVDSL